MIAVVAAMEEEFKGLKEAMSIDQDHREKGCQFHEGTFRGKGLLLMETGMGRRRASEGVESLIARFQPGAIVSTGYAGALDGSLRAGDMFIYSALCGISGELPQPQASLFPTLTSHTGLASMAERTLEEKGIPYGQGMGVSATRVAAAPETKRWLGEASRAKAVDMESYWMARVASEKGIPFIAVRAISDDIYTDISPLLAFINEEGLSLGRAVRYFLGRPWKVPGTLAYSGKVRHARRRLYSFLKGFVASLNDTEFAG